MSENVDIYLSEDDFSWRTQNGKNAEHCTEFISQKNQIMCDLKNKNKKSIFIV